MKLNSSNYLIWKAQILPLIQSLGVEGHLKNAPPVEVVLNDKDEAVPNNPAFTSWKDRDLLLRRWMTGTLSEEALYYVVGCNKARDIWNALEENLLQVTKDREVLLKQQLQDMRLGSQSLCEYLKSFKKVVDGLAAIHKPIPVDDKVIYLSRGIGRGIMF